MKGIKVSKIHKGVRTTQFGSCIICKRPLTRPESVSRGMGPICAAKQARKEILTESRQPSLFESISDGFIFKRTETGLASNVPWLVKHHSADGYEIGYGGSGPADAALNICETVLRRLGYRGATMKCAIEGKCFLIAFQMHQDFKWEFIASMARKGGTIPYQTAVDWVEYRLNFKEGLAEASYEYA